ncbi:MAG: 2-isopropylmalate synthase [Nitrospirae bacterium]|nr:MAG: 2-isopropylmalate synthase [Nitrospirota bacterium]
MDTTAEKVDIFDTTLRDGEQSPGASMNTEQKLRVARQLAVLGVDIIEAGFPIASPGDFEAVHRIAGEVEGPQIAGLARAREEDIRRAWEAVRVAAKPRIHTFLATSDLHLRHKLRMSREEALRRATEMVAFAASFTENVEFSPEDAARTDVAYLCEVVEAVIEAGARVVNIPDTVGYTIPEEFHRLIRTLKERVPNIERAVISVHCHNDLGLAVANSLAAVQAGARQVECTINGLGERAGNAALEEVVMALRTRHDVLPYTTGVRTEEIYRTSRLVSEMSGMMVQPNKAIVGANAFAHESGIHQDGILKHHATYEIMTPESIGLPKSEIVLGKHSGRHAFAEKVAELGHDLDPEQLEAAFRRFKALCDKKKYVFDEDVEAVVNETVHRPSEYFVLRSLEAHSGSELHPRATVEVEVEGELKRVTAEGDGPVDAALRAIKEAVGTDTVLEAYVVKAITGGTDAQGEVTVKIAEPHPPDRMPERVISGQGASTDIIIASANAYVNALNRMESWKRHRARRRDEPAAQPLGPTP